MPWTVTRQCQWPHNTLVVEISHGDINYSNPNALAAQYAGEFETFPTRLKAVETAIAIARSWKRDKPEKDIFIGIGSTGGMTMPFDPMPLTEEVFETLRDEAEREDAALPRCSHCGDILANPAKELWHNSRSEIDGTRFCSQFCAEKDEEIAAGNECPCTACGGPNDDGEGEDGLCGTCADKKERLKWRSVEVARAWAGSEGDRGDWDTAYYDIPRDTPEDKIEEVALKTAAEEILSDPKMVEGELQHLWIYSIQELEDEEEEPIQ